MTENKSNTRSSKTSKEWPKVSCLMVTANRKKLMSRSIRCFNNQNYPNKELVVVDDGEQELSDTLESVSSDELRYIKLESSEKNTLGKLRNISLEKASGPFLIQWDDDDWYHPERIKIQAEILQSGYDACCLSGALMHLDTSPFMHHPYVGYLPDGIPGSIMHRKDNSIKYPHTRRAEDTVFLKHWMEKRYERLSDNHSYLFIRCYHGNNTWEKEHFIRRIRNNPKNFIEYIWHKYIRQDLFGHPRFQLSDKEKEAFKLYLEDSFALGLLSK